MLYVKDCGCFRLGCDVLVYYSEVYYVMLWIIIYCIDINDFMLVCGFDNCFVEKGWKICKNVKGDIEWLLLVYLDYG